MFECMGSDKISVLETSLEEQISYVWRPQNNTYMRGRIEMSCIVGASRSVKEEVLTEGCVGKMERKAQHDD